MDSRRFELGVALQVALLLATCIAIAYLAVATSYYATLLLLGVTLAVEVSALLRYVGRTNRELARFMLAVRHGDLAQSFRSPRGGGSFGDLAAAFEEVLERLRGDRTETERHATYLEALVQHVPVAVLALDDGGGIDLYNHAARRLFGAGAPRKLRDFSAFGTDFPRRIHALVPGRSELIEVTREGAQLQLNALATEVTIGARVYKIVSLQDIHGELEAREIEAWQNLIRVLTHEIMNSATPISSLATTAAELLAEARAHPGQRDAIDDAHDAVTTIAQRTDALVRFVESYRRLTKVPKPAVAAIPAAELLDRVVQLMHPELASRGIALVQRVAPRNLLLEVDAGLLEQVLINLLRNAIDALDGAAAPEIGLTAEIDAGGRAVIVVEDNGRGMDEHVRANVFVPFFTTKRHGTGIGLALVRQIMRSHRGSVGVQSAPGRGTAVRLSF